MILSQNVLVIEKISKAYDFEGRQGVTRAVRVLLGTDIFRLKATEEILNQLEEKKEYAIDLQIRTVKEDPILEIVGVKKKN